jgi:hypothetical protein
MTDTFINEFTVGQDSTTYFEPSAGTKYFKISIGRIVYEADMTEIYFKVQLKPVTEPEDPIKEGDITITFTAYGVPTSTVSTCTLGSKPRIVTIVSDTPAVKVSMTSPLPDLISDPK